MNRSTAGDLLPEHAAAARSGRRRRGVGPTGRMLPGKKATDGFFDLLKRVRSRYPAGQTLHVPLDNYNPHASSSVVQNAHENDANLSLHAARSLNRIERYFTAPKKFAIACCGSPRELQEAILSYLACHDGGQMLA